MLASYAQDKLNIAVMELTGNGIEPTDVAGLSNRVRSELFKTGRFQVIERSRMDEILKEQGFQHTGCTNTECAVEIGQLVGVQKIVVGSVDKVSRMYSVDIRMVDVGTGKIEKNVTADCRYCDLMDVMSVTIRNASRELAGLQPDRAMDKKSVSPPQRIEPAPGPRRTSPLPVRRAPVADFPMSSAGMLVNVLGFLQFGPMFQGEFKVGENVRAHGHLRLATMGLAYRALVDGDVTGGIGLGGGITKFVPRQGTASRVYLGTIAEYGLGSNVEYKGTTQEWEGEHSYMAFLGNFGHRWRYPSKLFMNLGAMIGYLLPLSDTWRYTHHSQDTATRESEDGLLPVLGMIEFSVGVEL